MHRHISLLVLVALLALGCASTDPTSSPPAPSGAALPSAPAAPRPIVIDADMDHSDLAAILVLLRDPAVEVLGIAIDGTGLVHCQGGRLVTRYLLDELGVTDVPFGCGRQNGGEDARPSRTTGEPSPMPAMASTSNPRSRRSSRPTPSTSSATPSTRDRARSRSSRSDR